MSQQKRKKVASSRLVLNRDHIIVMLEDVTFYRSCPDFLLLRNTAIHVLKKYRMSRSTCRACKHDFAVARPVVQAFMLQIGDMLKTTPDVASQVKAYFTEKKGYPIKTIVLYYRAGREKKPQRLEF